MEIVLPRYDVPRAFRAVRTLVRDPDELSEVFTLIDAMSGTAPHRMLRAFRRTESGRALLRERVDIVPRLADRAALRALPDGSLGRAYLDFVESEGISAEGIRDASEHTGLHKRGVDLAYVSQRMRDTHDLWHAAVGYRGDVIGELALLAFILGQHWNTAIASLVLAGLVKARGLDIAGVVLDGYRRGRGAAWLPAQRWEELLPLPLEEVRARLRLGDPPAYTPQRTADLRAQGVL